jgi:DNA-binding SARP family transcriptional activator
LIAAASHAPGGRGLLSFSSAIAPTPIRRLLDIAVGAAFVTASLSAVRSSATVRARPAIVAEREPRAAVVAEQLVAPRSNETYQVQPGDSLWRIAEKKLGSGFRWREIYRLNRDRRFADGRGMKSPRLIRPGWKIVLPTEPPEAAPVVSRHGQVGQPHRSVPQIASEKPTVGVSAVPDASTHRDTVPSPVSELPSGLTLAGTFVAGLLSAELLSRLRRRRIALPDSELSTSNDEPTLVRHLRHIGGTSDRLETALIAVSDAWRRERGEACRVVMAIEADRKVTIYISDDGGSLPARSGGRLTPLIEFKRATGSIVAEVRGPFVSHIESRPDLPRFVAIGASRDAVVHLSLDALSIVSASGQRAQAFVRDLMLSLTSITSPDDLRVILLGGADVVESVSLLPHVVNIAADDIPETLRDLQGEFLRRARLFAEEGVEDVFEHDELESDDRLQKIVVVAQAPSTQLRGVIEALGREGRRFGCVLIAVGWDVESPDVRLTVGESDLQVASSLPIPKLLRPLLLDETHAAEALNVVTAAWVEPLAEREQESVPANAWGNAPQGPAHPESEPTALVEHAVPASEGMPYVACLGPYTIQRGGRVIPKGWRTKAKEMLAYLIVHPEGAPQDVFIDMLWPEMDPVSAWRDFKRTSSSIRAQVRTKDESRKYVVKIGESFRLEPHAWGSDVWEFASLIARAKETPHEEQDLLSSAVALYRGDFCSDCYFSWAEPFREKFRRMFLRASARLASILADAGDLEGGLAVLERAIEVDSLNEELYRRAMSLEATLGRVEEAQSRFRKLEAVLIKEIGVDPSPVTQDLVRQIQDMKVRPAVDYLEIARRDEEMVAASGKMP